MWLAACRRHVWRAGGGEGGLARGGSRRATLLLRPRRAAPALRLLAYYEPAASGAAAVDAARLRHRLLRHVFRFDVHEAVEVMATPRRTIDTSGSAVSEKMIIAVEIQNVSTDKFCTSVEILEASLLSKQWKLVELVAARDKNDALGPHEKLHIILEAVRITGGSNKIMPSGLKINKGDMLSQPDISVPPFSKFVLEYKTPFIEDEDFVRGKKSSGLIQTMLVVRWRARGVGGGGGGALGQHPVWLDCFTAPAPAPVLALSTSAVPVDQAPMTAPFAKHRKANVVLFKIEHAHHVQHNFNAKRICIVPITINIVNCYAVPVNAYIEMSNKRDETCAVGWAGAMGGDTGAGAGVAVALQQFEARRVRVRALVAAPGSYLLGDAFSLSIRVAALPAPPAPPPSLAIPGLVSHLCADASLLVVQQV